MVTSRHFADIGYKAFSGSMMILTLYGGYLCSIRAYRYFQRRNKLKEAAENQTSEIIKD
ncbi:cytochrome c oxidase assembly protein COX14 [Microcaecilia unicolor]|uniref:Cytochrome c oxidase assembly protein COX14 n=1 Tax=Microcaecilia unicolor TaxID=1415580 RepID=A0A6P7XEW9_9AMPH|nr:cytochrome c oxidase assembly protein COX14 [Microcaecilia unicolor]XP_030054092.1 cytochrome c oxidase assembly protein COX14 [Microcaecilia unicolor]XP_030054093.1 cytochrome c oxidase assembly protein COX14 [Microcaecilia unicolor]XP_030054094.1 cytochrome c oxidase assembly protein COX14 [Microcaecilia unicolor]